MLGAKKALEFSLKEFSASSEEFGLKLPLPQALLCVCLMYFAYKKKERKKRGENFSRVVDLSLGLGNVKTGILKLFFSISIIFP